MADAAHQPTIAIIGASNDRRKFGNKAVRAYLQQGFEVFPINPHEKAIEGLPVFRSVLDVPTAELDRISVYVPPLVGLDLLDDIARKPAREIWLNPGAESPELLAKARQLGLNVIQACSIIAIGSMPE